MTNRRRIEEIKKMKDRIAECDPIPFSKYTKINLFDEKFIEDENKFMGEIIEHLTERAEEQKEKIRQLEKDSDLMEQMIEDFTHRYLPLDTGKKEEQNENTVQKSN